MLAILPAYLQSLLYAQLVGLAIAIVMAYRLIWGVVGLGAVIAGITYLINRSGLRTVFIAGSALWIGATYFPTSEIMIGLKCGDPIPDVALCAQLVRQGWTRGWIMQAYGVKFINGQYVLTRRNPDLTVRERYQPTGNWLEDFVGSQGGAII